MGQKWGGEGERPGGPRSEAGNMVARRGPMKVVKIKIGPQKGMTSVMQIAPLWSSLHKSIRLQIFSIRIGKQSLEQVLRYKLLFLSLCNKSFPHPINPV